MDYTKEQIVEFFKDYVQACEDEPRHGKAAEQEAMEFGILAHAAADGDISIADDLINKSLDMAVEFEQAGFIAGFNYALEKLNK